MRFPILLLIILSGYLATAQTTAVDGEWFIDDDPGYGQATAFANPTSGDDVLLTAQIATADLAPGIHRYHARVRDADGRWSQTHSRPFLIVPAEADHELTAIEWFWDEDTGFGSGSQIPISGDTSSATIEADVSGLSPGRHQLSVRARDATGRWGPAASRGTFVREQPEAMIDRLTYYYVSDGDTSATFVYSLPDPQHYVDVSFTPDTTDLVGGQSYDFCISAVRTDNQISYSRCLAFEYAEPTTGLSEPIGQPLGIFPNPNNGSFRLELPAPFNTAGEFQLFNGTGGIVHRRLIEPGSGGSLDVAVPELASGAYFAVLSSGGNIHVQRVVIR